MATKKSSLREKDVNIESYYLIWLDALVNKSEENIEAQKQLRSLFNLLITFENEEEFLKYMQSISNNNRIILIVSGKLGRIIVPKIINYEQIVSIYVYCMNLQANKKWAKKFPKIKDVIVKSGILIKRIEKYQNKIIESSSISMIDSNDYDCERSIFKLNGDFLNSQLLIDCLLKLKDNFNDKKEFISYCKEFYKGKLFVLELIKEFEKDYRSDRALWWYTRDSFLYSILNKALRKQNIHLLYLLRFIIRDIEQELNNNKSSSSVYVYRAQLLSNNEIQMLKDSLGNFISIRSFFSTTLYRTSALFRCNGLSTSNGIEQVLFEIDADPKIDNIKPFADITRYSHFPNEQEILFMTGSIFRIVNINRSDDGILTIQMKLSSINDHHLKPLIQQMQNKYQNRNTNILDLCNILMHMGKWDDAEKYYYNCLNQSSDNLFYLASCYHGLGSIAKKNGDYQLSLEYHNKSLQIKMQIFKSDDPNIAASLNSIGATYKSKQDYLSALEYYEKALLIYKKSFGDDHLDVAMCINNIANIYSHQSKYSDALQLYQNVLIIREKHLPPDHPCLGSIRANIANTYKHLGQYDLALSNYQSSLRIFEKSRPSEHPSVATLIKNIGFVYDNNNDQEQALACFEEAARIYNRSLSSKTQIHFI